MGRAARIRVVESFDATAMTSRLEQVVLRVGALSE
jgi:hypothetical protein